MKSTLLDNLKRGVGSFLPSIGDVGKISVEAYERLVAQEIDSLQYYSKLGIEQMKAAVSIKDYDSAQSFVVKQVDLIGRIGKRLVEDGRAVAEIGKAVSAELKAHEPNRSAGQTGLNLAHQKLENAQKHIVKKLAVTGRK